MAGLYLDDFYDDFYKNEKYPTLYLYDKEPSGGFFVCVGKGGVESVVARSIRLSTGESLILPWEFT